jgi:hypothetical protein
MMTRLRRVQVEATLVAALATLGVLGCATGGAPGGNAIRQGPILVDELREVSDRDMYAAITLLRPQFFQRRGVTSFATQTPTEPEVYVDGMYYGSVASLRGLPAGDVVEVRMLNVGDAMIRYGTGHTAGVIDIRTRPRR